MEGYKEYLEREGGDIGMGGLNGDGEERGGIREGMQERHLTLRAIWRITRKPTT